MRLLIFGNSGSGKSTLAGRLAAERRLIHLDLDGIVWEPGRIAVPRPDEAVAASIAAFQSMHDRWVMEGCYGRFIERASPASTHLVFLNPGEAACRAHCQARPWEPAKYPSRAEQDARLPMLLEWVSAYYTREDDMSLAAHRRLFDTFAGPKTELTSPAAIAAFRPA
jgi:adenylate kinase family enzyme